MVTGKIVTYLILIVVLFATTIQIVRVVTNNDKTNKRDKMKVDDGVQGGDREHFIVVPRARNYYRDQERKRLLEKEKSESGTSTSTSVKPKDLTHKLVYRVSRRIYDLTDTNYKYSDGFLLNQCEILHNKYKGIIESQREMEKTLKDFGKNSMSGTGEEADFNAPKNFNSIGGGAKNCSYNLTDTQLTRLQELESRLEDFDNSVFKEDGLWPNYQEKRRFRNASIKISEL